MANSKRSKQSTFTRVIALVKKIKAPAWIKDHITLLTIIAIVIAIPGTIISVQTILNDKKAKLPEEISSLPHIVYSWNSSYSNDYLKERFNPQKTHARIKLVNASKEIIRNLEILTYLYPNYIDSTSAFLNTYVINTDYIGISAVKRTVFTPLDTISLDLLKLVLSSYIFNDDISNYKSLLFPQPYSKQVLKIVQSDEGITRNIYNFSPGGKNKHEVGLFKTVMGLKIDCFFGAPIKILVRYDYKSVHFDQIITCGLFYALRRNQKDYFPMPLSCNSIHESNYIHWNKINDFTKIITNLNKILIMNLLMMQVCTMYQ